MKKFIHILLICLCILSVSSCKLIDDDLSNCSKAINLDYQMQLITNLNVELSQVLNQEGDTLLSRQLREHFSDIFAEYAHDVDLWFYRQTDDLPEKHINDVVNDSRKQFTFFLPRGDYRHLAIANIRDAKYVELIDTINTNYLTLRIPANLDTIESQTTGLFSARCDMDINDTTDQTFNVNLYMVGSAMALIIDTAGCAVNDLEVFTNNTATAFTISDSIYDFSHKPVVHAEQLQLSPASSNMRGKERKKTNEPSQKYVCFTSVNFPSDTVLTENGYWQVDVYATMPDNTITRSYLTLETPLLAGDVKVIRCKMNSDGTLVPQGTPDIGVTLMLDWHKGDEHDIEL